MKHTLFFFFCFSIAQFRSQSYLPECNATFYALTSNTPQASNTGVVNTPSSTPFIFPSFTSGLAAGPAFGLGIANPSFWTVSNDTLWYSNGFSFVKSNHKIGNANASGIGGSANFIYALDAATGQVYSYNGLGNATLLTTITSYTNGGLVQDLVGDNLDNFYILDLQTPQALRLHNSSGSFVCSYSLSGISTSTAVAESFAIVGNTVNLQRGAEYYVGLISGASINFTQTVNSLNPAVDYASCPVSNSFTSSINSSAGTCLNTTLNLTANAAESGVTYSWTGSGIVGATNSVSVQINLPGVYSCTLQSTGCIPKASVSSYTVYLTPVISILGNTVVCSGNSTSLTVVGAVNYTWAPGGNTGSVLSFTPLGSIIYTIAGTGTNSCAGTTTVQIIVNANPTVNANASSTAVCSGASTSLSATGALTFTWNPTFLNSSTITVSPSGSSTYTVIGRDVNGCASSATVPVTVNSNPVVGAVASPTVMCNGNTTTLSVSGAISYTWYPVNSSSPVITQSPGVTSQYTVIGTDANGCSDDAVVSVTVSPNPILGTTAVPAIMCNGSTTTLSVSGAASYTWYPVNSSSPVITQSPGITSHYTVAGTDTNGCSSDAVVSVLVNPNPILGTTAVPAMMCNGSTTTLSVSGAISYTWYPVNSTSPVITQSPGITSQYTVAGADANGCSGDAVVSVTVNQNPIVSTTGIPGGLCSGSAGNLNVFGALNYTWNPGNANGAVFNVSPVITTTYNVTGSDAMGCSATSSVVVSVTATPVLAAFANPTVICVGSISTLSISGAGSYTWSTGSVMASSIIVAPVLSSTYNVTGANGICASSTSVSVLVNPNPTLTTSNSPGNICSGTQNTLSVSGALNYTWNPGSLSGSTVVVSPTVTTVYTVTGTYATGCSASLTTLLSVTLTPTVTALSNTTALCAGRSATLNANGAAVYSWSPVGSANQTLSVSPPTSIIYTVTGFNGICVNSQNLSITVYTNPIISASVINPTICSGKTTSLNASGSVTYNWLPGSLSGSVVAVSPGNTTQYTVTGTNLTGCSATAAINVSVSPTPTVSAIPTPSSMCANATAYCYAFGATTYSWLPSPYTGSVIIYAPPVTTTFSVIGTVGACTNIAIVVLLVNPDPTVTIVASPTVVCVNQTLTVTASGASTYTFDSPPYTSISPNAATISFTASGWVPLLAPGANSYGCENIGALFIYINPQPTITVSSAAPLFNNLCSGNTTTLSTSGSISYTWQPLGNSSNSVIVTPGTTTVYSVTSTNSAGCVSQNPVLYTVSVTPTPTISTASANYTACVSTSLAISAGGAVNYTWNPGGLTGSNIVISPASNAIYTITGANGNCISTRTITISTNANPTVNVTPLTGTICSGDAFTLTAIGANTYTWLPSSILGQSISVSPSVTSTYMVWGTNGLGCTATAAGTVFVLNVPTLSTSVSPTAQCAGSVFSLTATGASGYVWNPGNNTTAAITVTPVVNTLYTVTGFNGICSATQTLNVQVNPLPVVSMNPTGSMSVCSGNTISLSGNGATTYTWNPGNLTGTNVILSPLASTNYSVTGSNTFLCSNTLTFAVNVLNNPTVGVSISNSMVCLGESITLSAFGANTYTWNGTLTGITIVDTPTNMPFANYLLTGTDANGCVAATMLFAVNVQQCNGIEALNEITNSSFLYPNPNSGKFTLSLTSISESTCIEVYDALGQFILREKPTELIINIDLLNELNGIYFVIVRENLGKIKQLKMIKQ